VHIAWKGRPRNDLDCVGWGVKPYSFTHSPNVIITDVIACVQDECAEVRTTFIQKLHKGLMSLRLPLQYLSIMCLAANETDKSRRTVVKQMLTANVNRRREYLRQNSIANS